MAKKAKRPVPAQNVAPGADPHAGSNKFGRKIGNILGCVCLLVFIFFDELWIGTLAFAIGFAVIFGIQVFHEKSCPWYASPYLYVSTVTLALAYGEFQYGIISNLLKIG